MANITPQDLPTQSVEETMRTQALLWGTAPSIMVGRQLPAPTNAERLQRWMQLEAQRSSRAEAARARCQAAINNTLAVSDVLEEGNQERRSLFLTLYGIEAFFQDAKAVSVCSDRYGELFEVSIPWPRDEGEPTRFASSATLSVSVPDETPSRTERMRAVRVRNSTPEPDGTYKTYFLRVPPAIRTPREGIAWTFGLREEEYGPDLET